MHTFVSFIKTVFVTVATDLKNIIATVDIITFC